MSKPKSHHKWHRRQQPANMNNNNSNESPTSMQNESVQHTKPESINEMHHLGVQSIFLSCFVIIICISSSLCRLHFPSLVSFLCCCLISPHILNHIFDSLHPSSKAVDSFFTYTRLYLYIVGLHKSNVFVSSAILVCLRRLNSFYELHVFSI